MSRLEPSRWTRPIPLIGDPSAASERASDPAAWAFDPAERAAFYEIVGARRDIRRFRPDPVPEEVLRRVLEAAHAAPSVGHSQPWRFLVVRDGSLRDAAALMAEREKLAQADLLEEERARRLRDLSLEGIRAAPLGVVVCCDRRTPAAGVLGRATFPDADVWSCACAIQNLWLAARAEGLGMGWVTLFPPEELAALLGLPEGVVTLGWLCLGWPDERPPEPGLQRRGWSSRLPLEEVVLTDRWPGDEPAPPPSHLAAPPPPAVVAARDDADELLTVPSSLGVLDTVLDRILAVRPEGVDGGHLVLAACDHPVTRHSVSAYPVSVTRQILDATSAGTSQGAVAARAAGLGVLALDGGVLPPESVPRPPLPDGLEELVTRAVRTASRRGDLVEEDALTGEGAHALVEAGRAVGVWAAPRGLVVLGEAGIGNTTPAAALASALLDAPARETVGLGAGADSAMVGRKQRVVERALARLDGRRDPLEVLAVAGGAEFALLTGVVLGAAEHRGVVVLDGLATSVAALAAVRMSAGVAAHLVAGQRSRERGHALVLRSLGLEPLLDLRLRAGEGAGACLAAGMVLDGLRIRREMARTS
ncbi:5,6-dimethylbenzimidazole synthase [Actinocorallia sp. B10E7]|uniref:5,6-dimethylbenzimidazole synthase n=1 Tax=Actinocorallia sp. B10E7 TaxID=3153558 RepID=UPI00325D56BB